MMDFRKPAVMYICLLILFSLLAVLFSLGILSHLAIWWTLAGLAVAWLAFEYALNRKSPGMLKKAVLMGLFLMVFDFIFEGSGTLFGLWRSSHSILPILTVPVEVMLICLIGGAAWYLYLPEKFNRFHSAADILLFAFFGALGEAVLVGNGMMTYYQWWTSYHAFVAYGITWVILHYVRYRLLK
jgi:hypothetical protein